MLSKSAELQLFLEATEDTWALEMARGQVGYSSVGVWDIRALHHAGTGRVWKVLMAQAGCERCSCSNYSFHTVKQYNRMWQVGRWCAAAAGPWAALARPGMKAATVREKKCWYTVSQVDTGVWH